MRHLMIFVMLALVGSPSPGSTPAAWRELQRQAERSCIVASAFNRTRVSNMIVFDDNIGVVALLVTGTYRQPLMKRATGTKLCLYNRRTKKATVEEATAWKDQG